MFLYPYCRPCNQCRQNSTQAFRGWTRRPGRESYQSRYDRALKLIPELLQLCDICSIYDNTDEPYRIFKKRKSELFYDDGCRYWKKNDIELLTGTEDAIYKTLNE